MKPSGTLTLAALVFLAVTAVAVTTCADPPPAAPKPLPAAFVPPLEDAVQGEWLRISDGADSEKCRVVSANDYEVTVEVTKYHGDVPTDSPMTLTWHRNNFGMPANTVIRRADQDRIEVGGVWYDCWRLTVYSRDTSPRLYWISDKIPVHGVLKVANVGKDGPDERTAAKLVDWGPRGE